MTSYSSVGIVEMMQKTHSNSRWMEKLAVVSQDSRGPVAHRAFKMNEFPSKVSKTMFLPEVADGAGTPVGRWWVRLSGGLCHCCYSASCPLP